ncbi:MAG TPA: response regulator, partial [Planctomycetota bacterium]|nr:response regulator [Planctomycetota bacterium]
MIAPQRQPEGKPGLLVVDDDPLITDTLAFALGPDYEVYACDSRAHAIELLRQLASPPPLALVDLGLPPTPHSPDEGFQLIADLLAHSPRMKIFVLSGQNDAANARHARALGAWEFIAKPSDPALLKRSLARALELPPAEEGELVGSSPALAKLKSQIAQFAASPYSVLIEGESGSGKELAAASLH